MLLLRKQKIRKVRARKKSFLRVTKKQRELVVPENKAKAKAKAKARREMIRQALGFDKIKLKRKNIKDLELNEFEKAVN